MRKPKYLRVISARGIPDHIQACLSEQPARSGAFCWIFAFGGEIRSFWDVPQEEFENYDIIHVNAAPSDMPIIPEVRKALGTASDTRLVVGNDYVCECWTRWRNIDPYYYDQVQRMADMVFGTEPHQVSNLIEGAHCFPHPSNTRMLKRLGTDHEYDSIGNIFHWWSPDTYIPHRTCELAKRKFGIKRSTIWGYDEVYDDMSFAKRAKTMWDHKMHLMSFPDFAEAIQGEKAVIDLNPCHTYGRNGVEFACWKKPIVGSDRVWSYNFLFPELAASPYACDKVLEGVGKILRRGKEIEDMLEKAYENVEYFNYENSVKRFMAALESCKKKRA